MNPRIKFFLLYKKQIGVLFLLNLLSCGFFLTAPYFSQLFIDKAFINKDLGKFFNLSIIGVGVFIFSTLTRIISDIVKNKISIKLKLKLSSQFIRKFYSLDFSFFQSKSVGENIYRLSDIETVASFILEQSPSFLLDMVKLPIILGISLWLNPRLTAFLLILSPLFILNNLYLQKRLRPLYQEIWGYSANLSKEIYEAFSRILIIKALGLEFFQRHSYLRALIKNIRWKIKSFRWMIISSVSSSFLSKAIYGSIALYGGWLIIKGEVTLGSYTALMLYLNQLGGLIESLSQRVGYFIQEAVSFEKFFEIMETQPQIKDVAGARDLGDVKGEICFENVNFGYNGKVVLPGINLRIPPSSWVGIAGLSGCGKTTLINLILRLYDPQGGNVLLDGLNLKEIKLKSLRKNFALAAQQPFLFDVSLKENIVYGLKGIRQEDVLEAVKIAQLEDFICKLPKGMDTFIGEDGCQLSQGLKQRVALARAVLRNPRLLILDEAVSSVDSFTEEKIFSFLRRKRQGLSTIIISHRLFSIKDADRIYFLTGDGLLFEGEHNQLLESNALYRDFFHNQII